MNDERKKIIEKSSNPKFIEEVFEFAKAAYKGRKRLTGENYIEHTTRVAFELSEMNLDIETISAALLHDVIDDTPLAGKKIQLAEIEKRFGKEIADMVERISKLSIIRYSLTFTIKEKKAFTKEKIETLRKMFFALAGDVRVILIELISRMDGLHKLHLLSVEQQKLYSIETLEIFAPVANRLGLGDIKRKFEDLSFRFVFPKKYAWLEKKIKDEYGQREKDLEKFIREIKTALGAEEIKAIEISSRAKSYWSTYQKLAKRDMDFDRVHDLIAVRIIVPDIESCYRALGVIHKHYLPITTEINDYIAKPKTNGYRSLHTTVFYKNNKVAEVQIRTERMHKEAQYGVYAHWSYKENITLKKGSEELKWAQKVPDFWELLKIDFYAGQIFTLTPRGDIIVLKEGSTPVDFAYAVHSNIGDHCASAKVDNRIVPLSYTLKSGDVVEIVTDKKRLPSADWLRFVKTNLAQTHIKKAIAQDKSGFKFPIPGFIKRTFEGISEKAKKIRKERSEIKKGKVRQIYLAGQKGMMVNIAKCCSPQPGDKVHAYITKHRAAVLHKNSCQNFRQLAEKFPDRVINASWK